MLPVSSDTALEVGLGRTATWSVLPLVEAVVPLAWACWAAAAAAALSRLTTVTTASWFTEEMR